MRSSKSCRLPGQRGLGAQFVCLQSGAGFQPQSLYAKQFLDLLHRAAGDCNLRLSQYDIVVLHRRQASGFEHDRLVLLFGSDEAPS